MQMGIFCIIHIISSVQLRVRVKVRGRKGLGKFLLLHVGGCCISLLTRCTLCEAALSSVFAGLFGRVYLHIQQSAQI